MDPPYPKPPSRAKVLQVNFPSTSVKFKVQELYHDLFIRELQEMTSPLTAAMDVTQLSKTWCETCDPRLNALTKKTLANDQLLSRQLTFKMNTEAPKEEPHGAFHIDRLYCAGFDQFPDCVRLSKETASKLVNKLATCGKNGVNYIAREATHKVQISYMKGRVRWASKDEMKEKVTSLPQLAVISPSNVSSSTRLVIVPNRPVYINSTVGSRTYNSYVRKSSLQMPSLTRFSLGATLSLSVLFLDFEDCFGSLKHSYDTQLHSIVFCLKTAKGLPSYDLSQSPRGTLFPLIQSSSSFGASDVPALSQRAVSLMVQVYREHHPNPEVDSPTLDDLEDTYKNNCYVDDCQLTAYTSKVLKWSESYGRFPPFPNCECAKSCLSWECKTLQLTDKDLQEYQIFIKRETQQYLLHMAGSFLKISNFSSHRVKFVRGMSEEMQKLVDETKMVHQQIPAPPNMALDVIRPSKDQIQEELKRSHKQLTPDENNEETGLESVAAQLGKAYLDEDVYLKTKSLYLAYYKNGKSKQRSPKFCTFTSLQKWFNDNSVEVSKLTLASFAGQLFDTSGIHLSTVRSYIKEACRIHLLTGPKDWHVPVDLQVQAIFWKAVTAYFLLCKKSHKRCHLYLHPATKYYLLCGSDGSEHLESVTATLISYLWVGGQYRAKAQHLFLTCYSNHCELVQNMPHIELLAAWKGILMMQNTLRDLQTFGLNLPKESILFTIDARTTLLQIRTRSIFYKKKVQALIARIQQSLAEAGLSVFTNLAYIDQKSLPDGSRYHADILSKTKKQEATEDSILQDYKDLHHMGWIEQVPPSQWSWIQREYGLPAMEDQALVKELGVDPDFLDQVKDFLDKPTNQLDRTLHPATIIQDLPSDREIPRTSQDLPSVRNLQTSINNLEPDGGSYVPGGPEIPGVPGVPGTPCWKTQVEGLIERKMLYGLGPKSIISILEKVTFYLKKLRFLASLPSQDRSQVRERIKRDYLKNISNVSTWGHQEQCNQLLCGLAPKRTCAKKHLLLHPVSPQPETQTSKGEDITEQKNGAHSLFHSISTTGFGLGRATPETNKKLFHGTYQSSLSTRQEVFRHLCYLFNHKSEDKGFHWEERETMWGPSWVAIGRTQRDWLKTQDMVLCFHPLSPSSSFYTLCLKEAHDSSLGMSPELAKLYLASLNVYLPGVNKQLRELTKACTACNISMARQGRSDTQMRSTHAGPSGLLTTLGTISPGMAVMQVDLTGPLVYRSHDYYELKLWFLVCVSSHWGQVKILPVKSKSTSDVMVALKTLALQTSTKFELLFSDFGGEFEPLHTNYSPMQDTHTSEPVAERWFDGFKKEQAQLQLAGLGIFVRMGGKRHEQMGKVEGKIYQIKRVLKSLHLFSPCAEPCDLFEIHYLLALCEHVLHSRPVLISGGSIYSISTLRALTMEAGTMVGEDDGLYPRGTAADTKQKIDSACLRMKQLKTMVTTSMLAHSLPTLLDTVHRRERVKHGQPVDLLKEGDIVFDSIGFKETSSICGNICRILQLGASGNHCLLGKANLKPSVSRGQVFPQLAISRPSNYLHFICNGDNSDDVLIGENVNFDIVQYLPGRETTTNAHLWTLPPFPVSEMGATALTPTAMGHPSHQSASLAPAPKLAEAAEIHTVTKRGRAVKAPKRFGV